MLPKPFQIQTNDATIYNINSTLHTSTQYLSLCVCVFSICSQSSMVDTLSNCSLHIADEPLSRDERHHGKSWGSLALAS